MITRMYQCIRTIRTTDGVEWFKEGETYPFILNWDNYHDQPCWDAESEVGRVAVANASTSREWLLAHFAPSKESPV